MSKANDKDIPADEMLLAEAIAAARARGLTGTTGAWFRDDEGSETHRKGAAYCCALGALALAGRIRVMVPPIRSRFSDVAYGNDVSGSWSASAADAGESLGWAFRCAMED